MTGLPMVVEAVKSASKVIHQLLKVKPSEQVMIIADPETDMRMVYALAGEVENAGGEYTITIMPTRSMERSLEMTEVIKRGMEAADVVISMTRSSGASTYGEPRGRLREAKKIRTMSMCMRDLENWTKGGATADYEELRRNALALIKRWQPGRRLELTTPAGTHLTAEIGNHIIGLEAGFAEKPGEHGAFSDGEVSQGPNEGTANGVVVVDGPMCYFGMPDHPVILEIRNGRAEEIKGEGRAAAALRDLIAKVENANNFAEVGIGINPNSLRNGDFEEEKKALGTAHIALGKNTSYGGTTKSMVHMDMVLYSPTLKIDGRVLVKDGRLQLD
jgi:leucyl aminopeptidase (aminopeptidase T)